MQERDPFLTLGKLTRIIITGVPHLAAAIVTVQDQGQDQDQCQSPDPDPNQGQDHAVALTVATYVCHGQEVIVDLLAHNKTIIWFS